MDAFALDLKAPMMQLLPGTTPINVMMTAKPLPTLNGRVQPSPTDNDEGESEYEYETEKNDDEKDATVDDDSSRVVSSITEEESYEGKAENILENYDDISELDYIDDETDEDCFGVLEGHYRGKKRSKRKKKTFISGTMDIDILLAKDSMDPGNLVMSPQSPQLLEVTQKTYESPGENVTVHGEAGALAKKSAAHDGEKPWEADQKVQKSPSTELRAKIEDPQLKQDNVQAAVAEEKVRMDDTEWDKEGEEKEVEGTGEYEYEWEYYDDGEEEEEEKVTEEEETDEEGQQKKIADIDMREPWIVEGLASLMPRIVQRRCNLHELDDEEEEDDYNKEEVDKDEEANMSVEKRKKKNKGYKEWLEENSVILQTKIDDLLSSDEEEEKEKEDKKEDADRKNEAKAMEKEEEEQVLAKQKEQACKAQKLVNKLAHSEGNTLKQILFSLKDIFQTDRNFVYEFVRAGGVARLVKFGNQTVSVTGRDSKGVESSRGVENNQLQNLILRALGQVMLYVDGMNGVMAEPSATCFLYRLVASTNPLVCKTAVKLLLVFVEYTESNSSMLLQAVTMVDRELGMVPWTNMMTAVKQEEENRERTELAIFVLSLVNKMLYGIPEQDTFYNHTDHLEELGICRLCDKIAAASTPSRHGDADMALMKQVQLYNVALKQEDGEVVMEEDIR